jgi:hypothetical protein
MDLLISAAASLRVHCTKAKSSGVGKLTEIASVNDGMNAPLALGTAIDRRNNTA